MPQKFKSTCSYCGVGCGVEISVNKATGEIFLEGDKEHPASKGMLCSKGMNLHHTVADTSDRLKYPMMRYNKQLDLQRVSWEKALTRTAGVFKGIVDKYGPDSVGFYVSGQLLTEEYYIVNKLTKGFFKTNNIDTNSRLCMSSAVVGYKKALGEDSVPISYDDIELADCFFITGANPAWCHPILFRRIEAHKQANPDVKLIVADPRRTQTAVMADLHIQLKPGTDIYLNNAIARTLIETGKIDTEFIENHTTGFEKLKESAFQYSVEEAAKMCEIKPEEIIQASNWIGDAKGFISMWTMGLNQSVIGVDKNLSLLNLSLITGQIGKKGSGPFSLTGQPNAMGGREVGGLSTMLASHMDIGNASHREKMEKFWDVKDLSDKAGYTATQMIDAILDGKLKAIWIICTNPTVSLPDTRRVEKALKKANFVVVQDVSENAATTKYADLVLPAAGYMEKSGTMTNSDRRVSLVQKVVEPPAEAMPDAEILWRFAEKMGWKKWFNYKSYEDIYEEYKKTTQDSNIDVTGITYDYLKNQGTIQYPFRKGDTEGTPRLFTDNQFYTADKKAHLFGVAPENFSENVDKELPLILTTGRVRDQWHTMTRTGKVTKLNKHIAEPFLEIHPVDAEVRGIKEDDLVEVNGKRGNVRVRARVTDNIKKGVVFLPMHWGRKFGNDLGRANNLTSNLLDKVSLQPDYKFSAVQVEKFVPKPQKIAVVGAGAGATQLVQSIREYDKESEIEIFSKELNPFYNRVLLPDYLSGDKSWEQLVKLQYEQFEALNIDVRLSVSVEKINKEDKTIHTSDGKVHRYDTLVVATGSRPFIPPNFPTKAENFFTIRQKEDVDRMFPLLETKEDILVIGGGLLGLEMAGALHELDKKIHIVQIGNRLMQRQLDVISGNLLKDTMEEKGVKVHLNDEVLKFHEEDGKIKAVSLRSGKRIECSFVVCAIGTRPNTEILKEAGAVCGRGVKINHQLKTSLDDIYAIGEIAELNGIAWGITMAAEEQARVLAKVLVGDSNASYNGSIFMNILKIKDIQLCSIGLPEVPNENADEYQVVKMEDLSRRYYKKCIIHQNKLVGAILMGNKDEFLEFKEYIQTFSELDDLRDTLLRPGGTAKAPIKGALVCSCNNVGKGNIEDAIGEGCGDLDGIMQNTGAGTGCGSCKPEILEFLHQTELVAHE